jgi:hypothetical protein
VALDSLSENDSADSLVASFLTVTGTDVLVWPAVQ